MKIVFLVVVLLFAIFGLSEFLHILKLKIIFPKKNLNSHVVVNLQNGIAEKQLFFVCEQMRWYGKNYADFIIPIVSNLDEESYINCKQIAEKYGVIIPEEF